MALGLSGAFGVAGGQDAADALLKQRLEAEFAAERQRQQAIENSQRDRQLGLQETGQQFTQGRAVQQDAEKAAAAEQMQGFLRTLPPHLQQPATAQQFGLNIRPADFEDPAAVATREAAADAATRQSDLADYERKQQIEAQYRAPSQEPLVAVMGPDGNPVLVPRSEATGKRPASTREQGRSVTSGDAGRMADFDTSLNDLDALERDLGTTGAASKLGAMVPNVVSELTGFGLDAKQRQGTIDRVKQVIGKTLEGGVLRKEDEYKYEKILPTIGDPPEVAKAKLDGLRRAITLRRQTFLEDLGSANFDVSKFRGGGGVADAAEPATTGPVRMRAPDGRTLMVPADKVAEAEQRGATRVP